MTSPMPQGVEHMEQMVDLVDPGLVMTSPMPQGVEHTLPLAADAALFL